MLLSMNSRTGLTGIVTSLVFFAIGAVLHFAVHVAVTGLDYPQIGLIVMIVAGVGFVISLGGWAFSGRPKTTQVVPPQEPRR